MITFYNEDSFSGRENMWLVWKNPMAATMVVLLFLLQFWLLERKCKKCFLLLVCERFEPVPDDATRETHYKRDDLAGTATEIKTI